MSASTTDTGGSTDAAQATGEEEATQSSTFEIRSGDSWLNLRDNEEVMWDGQPHVYPILHWIVVPVVLCIILAWAVRTYNISGIALAGCGAVGLISILIAFWVYLKRASIQYVITNFGMYERRGVFSEVVTHVHLNRIQNTQYRQSPFDRFVGFGDVSIYTAGTSMRELKYETVRSPDEVDATISRQLDDNEFVEGADN